MHLQAAFLFAQEIGKFFVLTALDLLNRITQWRHNRKNFRISAVDLETMLFLCISIKNTQISWNCLFKNLRSQLKNKEGVNKKITDHRHLSQPRPIQEYHFWANLINETVRLKIATRPNLGWPLGCTKETLRHYVKGKLAIRIKDRSDTYQI
jgi:hypothetical protein